MPDARTDCSHLYLLVQRLLDRDILAEADAAELLAEADAARREQQSGRPIAALRHVERVALVTEALVRSDLLAPEHGQAVIQVANDVLNLKVVVDEAPR